MMHALDQVIAMATKAQTLDAALFAKAVNAMGKAFPDEDFSASAGLFDREPIEAVLHLVDEHLPDWTISLQGRADEVDGEWKCTLRKSDARDDDVIIGVGAGPRLGLAVLIAVLKASSLKLRV